MFERISWLAEILNVVLCLHFLYGQRVKSKAATGILVVADWFVMEVIAGHNAAEINVGLVYVVVWIYMSIEFGNNIRKNIVASAMWIILLGIFQLLACLPWILAGIESYTDGMVVVLQMEVMGILILLRKKIGHWFQLMQSREKIAMAAVAALVGYVVINLVKYRSRQDLEPGEFLPLIIFGILVGVLVYYWQKEKERREEKELELKISQLCEGSFRELIDTIRMKQHDFYNHIHTLQCLHYTSGNYEDLVKEQERYCADIKYDNRYYSLLNTESPVISGFLYGKFMEADRQGIGIEYDVRLKRLITSVPEYVIIEMTGILWDNAVQYVETRDDRRIRISLKEYIHEPEVKMEITVENPAAGLSGNKIPLMFQESYSTKKDHAGIGLNKIRHYTEKYPACLKAEKVMYGQEEWLCISVEISDGS